MVEQGDYGPWRYAVKAIDTVFTQHDSEATFDELICKCPILKHLGQTTKVFNLSLRQAATPQKGHIHGQESIHRQCIGAL